jgi:Na+-translocating ferredoxin:NAD+ oxidoreductase RnfD subunit
MRIMRHSVFYCALLALAVLVGGISLEILRYLHWSIPAYVVIVPIWISVLVITVTVGLVTFTRGQIGNRQ